MISTGELKRGVTIELDGQLYQILDFQHIKMGRGSAQVRIKLKDLKAGHTIEKSVQAGEKFIRAEPEERDMQYLYRDGDLYYFMDNENFEQLPLNSAILGDATNYLKESNSVKVLNYKNKPIGVELPVAVDLKIVDTGPAHKGDTASGGTKPAKLETGIMVQVPFYMNNGDTVKVDTRTGEFLSRVVS